MRRSLHTSRLVVSYLCARLVNPFLLSAHLALGHEQKGLGQVKLSNSPGKGYHPDAKETLLPGSRRLLKLLKKFSLIGEDK